MVRADGSPRAAQVNDILNAFVVAPSVQFFTEAPGSAIRKAPLAGSSQPARPCASKSTETSTNTTEAAAGDAVSALTPQGVTLCVSPFPERRSTIFFEPFDRPWDGEERVPTAAASAYVRPTPLPYFFSPLTVQDTKGSATDSRLVDNQLQHHHQRRKRWCVVHPKKTTEDDRASEECSDLVALKVIPRSGAYAPEKLTYILGESAVPFTALCATLARAGFTQVSGRRALLDTSYALKWIKRPVRSDFAQVQPRRYQKLNHFPGTWRIGKKDELHKHLSQARARWNAFHAAGGVPCSSTASHSFSSRHADDVPLDDRLFPEAWVLPEERDACRAALRAPENAGQLFIVKPTTSACGRGMFLLYGAKDAEAPTAAAATIEDGVRTVPRALGSLSSPGAPSSGSNGGGGGVPLATLNNRLLVQRYVADPYLVYGYKFDLRLYVVVTSFEPVRMYLYDEGLVRFATTPYLDTSRASSGGLPQMTSPDVLTAHLTNFTVNKQTETFVRAGVHDHTNTASTSVLNEKTACAAEGQPEKDEKGVDEPHASKWCLAALRAHMEHEGLDWQATMHRIHDLLCKVVLSIVPEVRQELRDLSTASTTATAIPCASDSADAADAPSHTFRGVSPFFEIYGVDVLLRRPSPSAEACAATSSSSAAAVLSPVVMEVNIMPSLSTHDSLLDQCIKGNFLADALTLVGVSSAAIKPPAKPTLCPGSSGDAGSGRGVGEGSQHVVGPDSTGPASDVVVVYDGFLDTLTDVTELEACLAAEEELHRAEHFARLLPTSTSDTTYAALWYTATSAKGGGYPAGQGPTRWDKVLSQYERWKAAQTAR